MDGEMGGVGGGHGPGTGRDLTCGTCGREVILC
jgi:hypothetical protein